MSVKYLQTFTVVGKGSFPIDMLRYDSCWPRRQQDVDAILAAGTRGNTDTHLVELERYTEVQTFPPTIARWRSFGWRVEPRVEVRNLKNNTIKQITI